VSHGSAGDGSTKHDVYKAIGNEKTHGARNRGGRLESTRSMRHLWSLMSRGASLAAARSSALAGAAAGAAAASSSSS
jgi:hypothetical protein